MDNKPISEQRALEAENAVLGSLLIDEDIAPQLFAAVRPDDFLTDYNREIFILARALFRNGSPVDPVTIRNQIGPIHADFNPSGKGEKGGDLSAYLLQLMETTPTSANWREYAKLMRQQATLSRIRRAAAEIALAQTLDECRPVIAQLSELLQARQGVKSWDLLEMYNSFLDYQDPENSQAVEYLPYGFPEIEKGIFTEQGDTVVMAGYPSDGKTALALAFAWTISHAPRNNAPPRKVGFFSLETRREKLRDRIITHISQADFSRIKRRQLTESDWGAVASMAGLFDNKKFGFTVIEAQNMSASDIQSVSRSFGFDVIFVDYIQLVKPETASRATRAEEVAAISRSFHAFAQSTKTVVFELSQFNREDARGHSRNPGLADLRESGQLEQDADAVFMIFRPDPDREQRIVKIAKNKEGDLGSWYLDFDAGTQTFRLSADQSGKKTARKYSDAGRTVKAVSRAADYPAQMMLEHGVDAADLPF